MLEILSPAGNIEKLKTAVYFGADACYFAGKQFGLRAFSDNFDDEQLSSSVAFLHKHHKKAYITLNILAHNGDFEGLKEYLLYLSKIGVDAVIVSDFGIMQFVKNTIPDMPIHVSTQANITNKYSAKAYCDMGAKRLILARELSVAEIKEIRAYIPKDIEIECFVHGAMCISYSGRCLLSNYLTGRDSNRGACVQACRWEYAICEKARYDEAKANGTQPNTYEIQEDNRGTYILNSKDMCMIEHLRDLIDAGVTSFKIEGRMKSPYYVATITNAYRRALDLIEKGEDVDKTLVDECFKTSHRHYTTGFYYGANDKECLQSSTPFQTHEFVAIVTGDTVDGWAKVEMRNRFKVGDKLEILSPNDTFNNILEISRITDDNGQNIDVADKVQQTLSIKTLYNLKVGDILRRKVCK